MGDEAIDEAIADIPNNLAAKPGKIAPLPAPEAVKMEVPQEDVKTDDDR